MAAGEKSTFYQALKSKGYQFEKHYRDYTAEELKGIWTAQAEEGEPVPEVPERSSPVPPRRDEMAELREQMASVTEAVKGLAELVTTSQRHQERQPQYAMANAGPPPAPARRAAPSVKPLQNELDPNEFAGATTNTHGDDDVLEVDEHGNQWYRKEVRKPAFAKPRGRRILKYDDPGVVTERVQVGEYVEEFEVAGDPKNARPSEIKITLPSYQTGLYKPPNMPFRVHTYAGARGFNMGDVEKFYGGADLVPAAIKRCYVSTDLCYDIQSTIRAIEAEYRERVLRLGRDLT